MTLSVPGFPLYEDPPENPLTVEGIELGRRLFYDKILSGDNTQACASCHDPAFAFSDPRQFSVGIDGIEGTRNAMALINLAWAREVFWDGREPSLEDQARRPVPDEIEMHLPWPEAVAKLQAHPEYPDLFQAAFGSEIVTETAVVRAIAQFERILVSNNSRYDKFINQEIGFTTQEIRGFQLFFNETGDCFHCHNTPLFTDYRFHNNGLDSDFESGDQGLGDVTGVALDRKKFRTPTLRNVELTAPYMHDGRFETLEEVVRHYNSGGHFTPTVDPLIRVSVGLGLSEEDEAAIVAFLKTLTDSSFISNPEFLSPFEE